MLMIGNALQALELLDQVEIELDRHPGGELEGNIPVSVGASVATGLGHHNCDCVIDARPKAK